MEDLPPASAQRLSGINRLLQDIFGEPTPRLSDLLAEQGSQPADITILRTRELDAYLEALCQGLLGFVSEFVSSNRVVTLRRRYGLDGDPPDTLAAIGTELGLSGERIRQLQKNVVRRLKHPSRKPKLKAIVADVAQAVLS